MGGSIKVVVGILMVVHLLITYTILQQVFCRAVCLNICPMALETGYLPRIRWFSITTIVMGLCWVLANAVPLFSDIVNMQGAGLSTWSGLTIPALLMMAITWKRGDIKSRALLWISIGILSASMYICVVGSLSSASI